MKKHRKVRASIQPSIVVTVQCKVRQLTLSRLTPVDFKKIEVVEKK